ncbi:hypothetical protein Pint_33617 [Pistacia integerrima]|uniref:Uncharacterized protein n=1 Tax=Pistacia integerrima TaxID=434235 RepID=A0ACC0X8R1_9ROSI|nr:hypothetical protein Pint_33617 [Pistacia integerrima]
MRFNGEISPHEPEPNEEQEEKESGNLQPQEFVVGYALTSKKKKSFLQPKLEVLARENISFDDDETLNNYDDKTLNSYDDETLNS